MISQAQLIANQKNSQFSCGPKSTNGKLTVRSNGVVHGILSSETVLLHDLGESARFEELLGALKKDLAPATHLESLLVRLIALDLVRLDRVFTFTNTRLRIENEGRLRRIEAMYQKEFEERERQHLGYSLSRKLDEHLSGLQVTYEVLGTGGVIPTSAGFFDFLMRLNFELHVDVRKLFGVVSLFEIPVKAASIEKLRDALFEKVDMPIEQFSAWLKGRIEAEIEELQGIQARQQIDQEEAIVVTYFHDHTQTMHTTLRYETHLRKQIAQSLRQLREVRELTSNVVRQPDALSDEGPASDDEAEQPQMGLLGKTHSLTVAGDSLLSEPPPANS